MLGLFAALALTLASVGIYSVLSYIVRGRSREIGIRTALGARTGDVLRLVVAEGMTPTLVGIAGRRSGCARLGEAAGQARVRRQRCGSADAGGVAGTLAFVALLASLVPAYRAARLDPLNVLRDE